MGAMTLPLEPSREYSPESIFVGRILIPSSWRYLMMESYTSLDG